MALSIKLRDNKLVVLDKLELAETKTKEFLEVVNALDTSSALIVTDQKDERLELASRNVPDFKIMRVEGLNVYDILKYENLILLESTLKSIEKRLLS